MMTLLKNNQLTEFSLRMKESGYHEKMRGEVMRRGIETYEKQVEREVNGICPLYRQKGDKKKERRTKEEQMCHGIGHTNLY